MAHTNISFNQTLDMLIFGITVLKIDCMHKIQRVHKHKLQFPEHEERYLLPFFQRIIAMWRAKVFFILWCRNILGRLHSNSSVEGTVLGDLIGRWSPNQFGLTCQNPMYMPAQPVKFRKLFPEHCYPNVNPQKDFWTIQNSTKKIKLSKHESL